jgi:ABC-type transport system involved in multi-copper enzyme maturation permease subunit
LPPRPVLEVAKKEFVENVLSWRFLIALVLATLVLTTSVIALSSVYKDDQQQYLRSQGSTNQNIFFGGTDFFQVAAQVDRVLGKPVPLSIFAGGPGTQLRRDTANSDHGLPKPPGGDQVASTGQSPPMDLRFPPLDFGFVVGVVMSFMAILFSYDSISGERERGTLKIMLANPLPKDSVLFGKYLGGMASLLLPLAIALGVALVALRFTGVAFSTDDWVRLGFIVLLAVPLISVFYLLGLLVSSLARRSSVSLLALTLVWLVLVFGAGNAAAVAAKGVSPALSPGEIEARQAALDEQQFNEQSSIQDQLFSLFQAKSQSGNLTPEQQAALTRLQGERQSLEEKYDGLRANLSDAARAQLDTQLDVAETIAAISPSESYRDLATSLAQSDYWTYRDAVEAANAYQKQEDAVYQQWLKDHPSANTGGAVEITAGGVARQNGTGPQWTADPYHYAAASAGADLASSRGERDLAILLGTNLALFVAAYAAILRYDVR